MTILYTVEENIFAISVYKLLVQKKYSNVIRDYFKINGKQRIIMRQKGEYVKFKNYERKIKSPFIIYTDFTSILVTKDDGKQNPEESHTNKYQKHIACNYFSKLVCVDDKFSKPFQTYLGEDAVCNFI